MFGEDFNLFKNLCQKPGQIIENSANIYEDFPIMEQELFRIQKLTSFPKAFNFMNIYKIKSQSLTDKELNYLNALMPYVNKDIFNNPRLMQKFMSQALRVYKEQIDLQTVKNLKPLAEKNTWLSTELDTLIGKDIFLS